MVSALTWLCPVLLDLRAAVCSSLVVGLNTNISNIPRSTPCARSTPICRCTQRLELPLLTASAPLPSPSLPLTSPSQSLSSALSLSPTSALARFVSAPPEELEKADLMAAAAEK